MVPPYPPDDEGAGGLPDNDGVEVRRWLGRAQIRPTALRIIVIRTLLAAAQPLTAAIQGQAVSDFHVTKSASDRFTTPLLAMPKAVTVIPAEEISQTCAVSLTEALRTVPGITIGGGEGGNPVGDNRDFLDTDSDIGTVDVKHDFGNGVSVRNLTRYGRTTNDYIWTQPDDSKGHTML